MSKIKGFLKNLEEDVKGVKKGAITLIACIEFVVCMMLVALVIVFSLDTYLANSIADMAVEAKDDAVELKEAYKKRAKDYENLYNKTLLDLENCNLQNDK